MNEGRTALPHWGQMSDSLDKSVFSVYSLLPSHKTVLHLNDMVQLTQDVQIGIMALTWHVSHVYKRDMVPGSAKGV